MKPVTDLAAPPRPTTVPTVVARAQADPRGVDEQRSAIIEAAGRLLREEGPGALTVRRIATEAGGSTMNVYSRFGGKDGVLDALYREGFEQLAHGMMQSPRTADPVADLCRCGAAYRTFALGHPAYYTIMFDRAVPGFTPTPESRAFAGSTLGMLAERVQRAIDAGQLAGVANELAADLWATNHGLVSLELRELGPPQLDWAQRHTETIDALLRGLAPRT
jgi:AcrR family transcriptional regulator